MGCHTWFYRPIEKGEIIEDVMDEDGNGYTILDTPHDVFRRGDYPDDRITSFKDAVKYLDKNADKIYYWHTVHDDRSEKAEEIRKYKAIRRLLEFFMNHPDGYIIFG